MLACNAWALTWIPQMTKKNWLWRPKGRISELFWGVIFLVVKDTEAQLKISSWLNSWSRRFKGHPTWLYINARRPCKVSLLMSWFIVHSFRLLITRSRTWGIVHLKWTSAIKKRWRWAASFKFWQKPQDKLVSVRIGTLTTSYCEGNYPEEYSTNVILKAY